VFPKRQSGLEIVHTTWFAHEAHVARSLLASRGIEAWVLDAEQIGVQWHVAGALGGVKVAVDPADAERARAILAEDHSAVFEEVDEAVPPPAADERCPRCGAAEVEAMRATAPPGAASWLSMGAFFLLGFAVPRRRAITHGRCLACRHAWTTPGGA
jgi:hypothetical protein